MLPIVANIHVVKNIGDTATKFNAETHIAFIEETFKNLKFDEVSDFAVAQTADSTALNPKIARLLEIFHMACRNHCLNLSCEDMEEADDSLAEIAEQTQECHRRIKSSNVLTAALANVQEKSRSLKLQAKTRWGSMAQMLESHIKSADDIRAVATMHPDRVSVSIYILLVVICTSPHVDPLPTSLAKY